MRRTIILICLATVALGATGIAMATFKGTGVQPATASFATTSDNARATTCYGGGDTYRITTGRYVGKIDFAAPNDELDGDLTLSLRAVYNTTDKIGWVEGTFASRDHDKRPNGSFRGVLGESGGQLTMSGFVNGTVNRRVARLIGGLTATLKANEKGVVTAVDGTLGQGTPAFPAVLAGMACTGEKPAPVAVKLTVRGTISSLAADAISVQPTNAAVQTCAIKSGVSPSTAGFVAGQKVEMGCGIVENTMTLLKLKRGH